MLTYASVCSGIEAPSVAWSALGWRPLWFAEIEPFPSAVLAHRWPEVPNHGDFTKLLTNRPADVDVLVGGTPCQSFSVAGLRGGLTDPRGNLALAFMALVDVLRPRWVVWENVPGVLSSNGGRDFGSILGALGQLGYGFAYRVLDAQYFGLAQRRKRVFVVGHLGDWRRAAAVLFEPEGVLRDSPPRRETGARTAGALGTGASDGGGFRVGADEAAAGHVVPHGDGGPELPHGAGEHGAATAGVRAGAEGVSVAALTAGGRGISVDQACGNMAVSVDLQNTRIGGDVLGTLDTTRPGRGGGQAVMVQSRGSNVTTGDLAGTLGSNVDRASGGAPCVLAYSGVQSLDVSSALLAHPPRIDLETETFVAHTLRAEGHDASEDGTGHSKSHANGGVFPGVAYRYGVRRLMPHELERLQGFPSPESRVRITTCEMHQGLSWSRSASPAEHYFDTAPAAVDRHVPVCVRIDYERSVLQLRSPERSRWFALNAEASSTYRLPIVIADIARPLADMTTAVGSGAQVGRAVSLPNRSPSTPPENGRLYVQLFGRDTEASVSDAGVSPTRQSAAGQSITSGHGRSSPTSGSTLATLCCVVVDAIGGSILGPTPRDCSCVDVEWTAGFTKIPYRGKPAEDCPDGPRAKALGNSMATPVVRWIGARIELVTTLRSPT